MTKVESHTLVISSPESKCLGETHDDGGLLTTKEAHDDQFGNLAPNIGGFGDVNFFKMHFK